MTNLEALFGTSGKAAETVLSIVGASNDSDCEMIPQYILCPLVYSCDSCPSNNPLVKGNPTCMPISAVEFAEWLDGEWMDGEVGE